MGEIQIITTIVVVRGLSITIFDGVTLLWFLYDEVHLDEQLL